MFDYIVFHKPFQVLTQFSSSGDKKTLSDFLFSVPKDVYPVGRLDYDSEGLLFLTNDRKFTHRLLHPSGCHERTYWVQVEGIITPTAIQSLRSGVKINVNGRQHTTLPAAAKIFSVPPPVYERIPPVRFRKTVPDSWLSLTLVEGKNRQIRKMTAAVGFPTLRLIRYSIGGCTLEGLAPGCFRKISKIDTEQLLLKTTLPA